MPPMDPETTGGISTGHSSYLGRFCVPPYSQNAGVAYCLRFSLIAYNVEVSSRATFSPHNDSIGCHVTLFDNEITQKRCRII